MLINMNMGSEDSNSVCKSPPAPYNDFPTPQRFSAPEIPTPPPPPPPIKTICEPPRGLLQKFDPKRRSRLRNFNWEAIPVEKVRGRTSLWSSETFQGDLQIDTGTMEELFGKHEEEIQLRSYHPRRSLSSGDAHVNKVFLLDSRRSMNIAIFLKQFKRSAAQIVDDIRRGKADIYSSERLAELLKHLPDREEVQRLTSFQGDRERLSEADLFMLLLLDVPSYSLRLEALILKKDFYPAIVSQLAAAREITAAVEELLHCSELHFILKLVLKAGNIMNAGGYAGNAAGFRVSSLLKLADTKANKPGMNLLHFVVMEVQKKDAKYLSFADRLKHVQSASRLSEDSLLEEFNKLQSRVKAMHQNLASQEQQELRHQMEEFLEYASEQLQEVQKEIDELHNSKHRLAEFLCEDEDAFHLEECCKIFSCFCQKFQMAIKENKVRELEEQRQQQWEKKRLQKRHSMATCGSLEAHQATDELELTLERNLRNLTRTSSVRLCRMRSLGSHSPNPFVPQIEQRERIQEYCDQKNAEQMREISERVLRQQLEYKALASVSDGSRSSFHSMPMASMNTSSPRDKPDLSELVSGTQASNTKDTYLAQPVQQESHNTPHVKVQHTPKTLDNMCASFCALHSKNKPELIEQPQQLPGQPLDNSDFETVKQSKPLYEATMLKQSISHDPLQLTIPLHEPKINRQPPLHFVHSVSKETPCHSEDQTSRQDLTSPDLEMHCQVPFQHEAELTKQEITENQLQSRHPEPEDKDSLKTQDHQEQFQSKIIHNIFQTLYHSGSQTLKSIPEYLNSTDGTKPSPLSYAESSTNSETKSNTQMLDKQGNKPRVPSKSKIPKQLPIKNKEVNNGQTTDESGMDFKASEAQADLDGSLESIYQTESGANTVASMGILHKHKADDHMKTFTSNVSVYSSNESDTEQLIHPLPDSLRLNDSPKQAKRYLVQSTLKTFKQTLIRSAVKPNRQSALPVSSSPSLAQRKNETTSQMSRTSLSQPGSFMSRIKHVEHLSVKQPIKEINSQPSPSQHNVLEGHNAISKAQDTDYSSYAKGLKNGNAPVQREAPNPCSKWKRELRNTPEKVESCRIEFKTENDDNVIVKNSTEHKNGENVKNFTLVRTGSSIPKKLKNNDLGIRKVLMTTDAVTGQISPSVSKQPTFNGKQISTESKDGKAQQKASVGSIKPPLSRSSRSFKEKRESGRLNNSEYNKSETKSSPIVTSRRASTESTGHTTEYGKEPVWSSQISPKKPSSVARVAIHVIKHYEVSSTLTRGSRSPYLAAHPVWR
ncbi:uncharacterized protein PAF06_002756 [Gastrophryne carolinensis]